MTLIHPRMLQRVRISPTPEQRAYFTALNPMLALLDRTGSQIATDLLLNWHDNTSRDAQSVLRRLASPVPPLLPDPNAPVVSPQRVRRRGVYTNAIFRSVITAVTRAHDGLLPVPPPLGYTRGTELRWYKPFCSGQLRSYGDLPVPRAAERIQDYYLPAVQALGPTQLSVPLSGPAVWGDPGLVLAAELFTLRPDLLAASLDPDPEVPGPRLDAAVVQFTAHGDWAWLCFRLPVDTPAPAAPRHQAIAFDPNIRTPLVGWDGEAVHQLLPHVVPDVSALPARQTHWAQHGAEVEALIQQWGTYRRVGVEGTHLSADLASFREVLHRGFHGVIFDRLAAEALHSGDRVVLQTHSEQTSSTCPACRQHFAPDRSRTLTCPACDATYDRDVLAAINHYHQLTERPETLTPYWQTLPRELEHLLELRGRPRRFSE
jgi:Putative transposase DNA-binding domain